VSQADGKGDGSGAGKQGIHGLCARDMRQLNHPMAVLSAANDFKFHSCPWLYFGRFRPKRLEKWPVSPAHGHLKSRFL